MLKDKDLEKKLLKQIEKLRRTLDSIGPTDLRQYMDEKVTMAFNALNRYEQDREDQIEAEWQNYVSPTKRAFEWE